MTRFRTWLRLPATLCAAAALAACGAGSSVAVRSTSKSHTGSAARTASTVLSPQEVAASLATTCKRATGFPPAQADGQPDFTKIPLWIPVVQANVPGGFAGCAPRVLVFPQLDGHQTEQAFAQRAGVPGQIPPWPVFRPDGTLAGYSVPDMGFLGLSTATAKNAIGSALQSKPPTPDDFAVVVGPMPNL